jgi:hypothetical protein
VRGIKPTVSKGGKMNQVKSVRFELTEEEKNLLANIAKADGRAGMSATIRRLIRNEAKVRGLEAVSQTEQAPSTL